MKLVSFDIGYRNLAFAVTTLKSSSNDKITDYKTEINKDGTLSERLNESIKNFYLNNLQFDFFSNNDITGKSIKTLDADIFIKVSECLDQYDYIWKDIDTLIIEKQMSFRGVYNVNALKIAQHVFSYFLIKYNIKPQEYDAYHKTTLLGAPKTKQILKNNKEKFKAMTKPERKKWAIAKSKQILSDIGDEKLSANFNSFKKKDDISDCLLMNLTYLYYHV